MIQGRHILMLTLFALQQGIYTKSTKTTNLNRRNEGLRIVNGNPVKEGTFPFMVSIIYSGTHKCGGSIVSENFILTASHCCYNSGRLLVVSLVSLSVGHLSWRNGTRYKLAKIVLHEDYDELTQKNDIALMKTLTKIIFGSTVASVKLNPSPAGDSQKEIETIFLGWGYYKVNGEISNKSTDLLMSAQQYAVPFEQCNEHWPSLSNSQICMTNPDEMVACSGDSGGPLIGKISKYVMQIGLLSFGDHECRNKHPDVFTRVSAYYTWIRNVMKKNLT